MVLCLTLIGVTDMANLFKRYVVRDTNGTEQHAYTLKGAMAWLPACAQHCYVKDKLTGQILAARLQGV